MRAGPGARSARVTNHQAEHNPTLQEITEHREQWEDLALRVVQLLSAIAVTFEKLRPEPPQAETEDNVDDLRLYVICARHSCDQMTLTDFIELFPRLAPSSRTAFLTSTSEDAPLTSFSTTISTLSAASITTTQISPDCIDGWMKSSRNFRCAGLGH
jgi:hypothetical protein